MHPINARTHGFANALATLALIGCGHTETATPEPVTAAETQAPQPGADQPRDARAHMWSSFWDAIEARDALIEGDLAAARRLSKDLSEQDFSNLPGDWTRAVAEMQQYAADAAIAPDVEEAAMAMAKVAVTCGNCHQRQNAHPALTVYEGEASASPEEVRQRMARHESAADDLWTGLMAPSDKAWKQGGITLRDLAPQPPVSGGEPVDADFAAELNEIKALGLRALTAGTLPEREQVYGDYLSRCAGCHSVTTPAD